MKSKNYHDYVIKKGKFIGNFEEMYQNVKDPWLHGDALDVQYDIILYLIDRYKICHKKGKILDIGCGKGAFTARLKKKLSKSKIIAIDIAPTAIKKASKKYGILGIDFKVMNIQKDYKDINSKFNLILISQIMWYILPDFPKIISYLSRKMLAKGGYILINQVFYKPGVQKYGNKFIQAPKDMINLVELKLIERIDIHKSNGYNVVALFKKTK